MEASGTVINGRYRILELIGQGGMGEVFLAEDELLRRKVAVKKIITQNQPEDHRIAVDRLIREARAAAQIHHSNVVTIYDVVAEAGGTYIVMEYLPAINLAQSLRRDGRQTPSAVASVAAQVADGLQAAHRLGIVHRDVKPANILITPGGVAKLADFGVAHTTGDATLTTPGSMVGSLSFMAPEVARGESATSAADMYSLGATMFALLEGLPPFVRPGDPPGSVAMLTRALTEPVPVATSAGPLSGLISALLQPHPALRPTASQVSAECKRLAPALAERTVAHPAALHPAPPSPLTPPPPPPSVVTNPMPGPMPPPPPDPLAAATMVRAPALPQPTSPPPAFAPPTPAPRKPRRWRPWLIGAVIVLVMAMVAWISYLQVWRTDYSGVATPTCEGPLITSVNAQAAKGQLAITVKAAFAAKQELMISVDEDPSDQWLFWAHYHTDTAETSYMIRGDSPSQTSATLTKEGQTIRTSVALSELRPRSLMVLTVWLVTLGSDGNEIADEDCGVDVPIR